MTESGGGTAIMLAVAALLWFVYLVPTWLRRREYLATERTATRLQQTMRVLAETAEIPDEVRVAATAREAARQERLLRAEQRRADAMAMREAAAIRRATPRVKGQAVPVQVAPEVLRRQRIRRTRRIASGLMIVATVVTLWQLSVLTTSGMTVGTGVLLGVAVLAGAIAIAVQRRLDAVAMPRAATRTQAATRTAVQMPADNDRQASWTPRELPKPRYLAGAAPDVVPTAPSREDLEAALRAATAEAETTLRAAQAAPEVVQLRPASSASPYARMGVLGPDAVETRDLDEVLRRRRNAG